ncbi:hypothetical protein [Pseudoalteromonas sp. PS5]|uniref:RbmA family biofilm matrix protein n=1 Tax=Pseudoalteromonas sp. PS5 TaxID=1437473 RepID=UPI000FFF3D25|nr:hypothetical protein [Pseudoalteromonas sp. PS5]RXF06331.1 hypothetical protein D9603_02030 [Pseudoalteromonas sp. PS5]
MFNRKSAYLSISCLLFSISASAEIITVHFDAKVRSVQTPSGTERPQVQDGENLNFTIAYDTEAELVNNYYVDSNPNSYFSASFEGGLTASNKNLGGTVHKIESNKMEFPEYNEVHYDTNFSPKNTVTNNGESIYFYLQFKQITDELRDVKLISDWNVAPNYFVWTEALVQYNRSFIYADITNFTVGNTTSVITSVEAGNQQLATTGGTVNYAYSIANQEETGATVEAWEYITMPDGTAYNLGGTSEIKLAPKEEYVQTGRYFTIPAYWPAGQYTYNFQSMLIDGGGKKGEMSKSAFTFIKE